MKSNTQAITEVTAIADQIELGSRIISKLAGGVLSASGMKNLESQLSIRLNNKISKKIAGGL